MFKYISFYDVYKRATLEPLRNQIPRLVARDESD
jgi:hypothetical protein